MKKLKYDPNTGSFLDGDKPALFKQKEPEPIDPMVKALEDIKAELQAGKFDGIEECLKDLTQKVSLLAEIFGASIAKLAAEQAKTTQATNDLVAAYKAPKQIIRDDDGKPQGIR